MNTVREFTPEELAEAIVRPLKDVPPSFIKFSTSLMRLLQHGNPVSPAELASATDLEARAAVRMARRFGSEFDDDGNIVASGLSLTPTPHKYHANGKELFAWCAVDTITFPSILKHSARIESPDPISGEIVRLSVGPEGVEDLDPSAAVVSWSMDADIYNIRGSFCNMVHFFASRETAEDYISQHPGLVIVSVDSVFEAAKTIQDKEEFQILLEE